MLKTLHDTMCDAKKQTKTHCIAEEIWNHVIFTINIYYICTMKWILCTDGISKTLRLKHITFIGTISRPKYIDTFLIHMLFIFNNSNVFICISIWRVQMLSNKWTQEDLFTISAVRVQWIFDSHWRLCWINPFFQNWVWSFLSIFVSKQRTHCITLGFQSNPVPV